MMQVICNPSPPSFFFSFWSHISIAGNRTMSQLPKPAPAGQTICWSHINSFKQPVLRYQHPKMLLRIRWRSKATARNLTLQIPLTGVAILLISGLLRAAGGTFDPPRCLWLWKMSPAESHRAAAKVLVPVTEAVPGLLCR